MYEVVQPAFAAAAVTLIMLVILLIASTLPSHKIKKREDSTFQCVTLVESSLLKWRIGRFTKLVSF